MNLLIICISAKSAAQILSLNAAYTFLFLIFLIMGLWSSSANCSLWDIDLIADLYPSVTPLSLVFYQKIYKA